AGGPALLARFAERGRTASGAQELAALAAEGDPDAVALVREAGRRVGEVLSGAVNLLNPAVIVLGGHLGTAFDHLAAGVREAVFARCTALATRQLRIAPNRSGGEAGLRGGAALVLDHILAPEAVDAALAAGTGRPAGVWATAPRCPRRSPRRGPIRARRQGRSVETAAPGVRFRRNGPDPRRIGRKRGPGRSAIPPIVRSEAPDGARRTRDGPRRFGNRSKRRHA